MIDLGNIYDTEEKEKAKKYKTRKSKYRKDFGLWSYDDKRNKVVMCDSCCNKNHSHYSGKYEDALIYFTGGTEANINNKHFGNLMNVIIAHQTNDKFINKTSAELYDILYRSSKSCKYYIEASDEERERYIHDLLDEAFDLGLIYDERICKSILEGNSNKIQLKRANKLENFEKNSYYKGFNIYRGK